MDLFSFRTPDGNFGDDLNDWIWDGLLPGWREAAPDHVLVGVGTLLNNGLPRGRPKIVVGTGAGYGEALPDRALMDECRVYAVRGPRSAQALGLDPARGIVDPAVMLPEFPEFRDIAREGPPIFVPHQKSVGRHDWDRLCAAAGVEYVSPCQDARSVIRRLARAPLVIAESMHAAIIADAFGTPWHPVVVNHVFHFGKWSDWAESLGMTLRFTHLDPVLGRYRRVMREQRTDLPGQAPRPEGPQPAGAPPQAQPQARRQGPGLATRLRRPAMVQAERFTFPRGLRRIAAQPGSLSDRAVLRQAQDRYRAALGQVAADLGLSIP